MDNHLRRTRLKLKVLEETEGIKQIIHDALLIHRGNLTYNTNESEELIEKLVDVYKRYIERHTPEDFKQQKLKL